MPTSNCPLCQTCIANPIPDLRVGSRQYFCCPICSLISADPVSLPGPEVEKNRYLKHQNNEGNAGYTAFLQSFVDAIVEYVPENGSVLDFGCGPEPVLASLLSKHRSAVYYYDPYFFPELPSPPYEAITCTEVIEHFYYPAREFSRLHSLLTDGGVLAVMTHMWSNMSSVKEWYYLRDITHVSFYHTSTMEWIACKYGLDLIFTDSRRITVFRRPSVCNQ